MDWRTILDSLLTYGKGPIVRGIAWAVAGLLAKHGVDQGMANGFSEAVWPAIASTILAVASLVASVKSAKSLHEAPAPSVTP